MDRPTILDYVEGELRPFSDLRLNAVDSLVLCQLAYLRLAETFPEAATERGLKLRDLHRAECAHRLYGGMRDAAENHRLIAALAASPRFREARVRFAVNRVNPAHEKQFAAAAFELPGAGAYVAFRGTDASVTGWKEDFNLAVRYPVPSQEDALHYLEMVAARSQGALYMGGHSKGGNLAVYAAARATDAARARLVRVFDHDGPGFPATVAQTPRFRAAAALVDKTVPEDSVVGQLLTSVCAARVVRSAATGIMQHDPYSWEVDLDQAEFAPGQLSRYAQHAQRSIAGWVASMDPLERRQFVDALFDMLGAAGPDVELRRIDPDRARALGRAMAANQDESAQIGGALGKLAKAAAEARFPEGAPLLSRPSGEGATERALTARDAGRNGAAARDASGSAAQTALGAQAPASNARRPLFTVVHPGDAAPASKAGRAAKNQDGRADNAASHGADARKENQTTKEGDGEHGGD